MEGTEQEKDQSLFSIQEAVSSCPMFQFILEIMLRQAVKTSPGLT